ncbi:hypothetical protein FBU30_008033 [Linnemannia zychae]|nr:hypothetical protein FBU30_008033 [Linnemannia zychae]
MSYLWRRLIKTGHEIPESFCHIKRSTQNQHTLNQPLPPKPNPKNASATFSSWASTSLPLKKFIYHPRPLAPKDVEVEITHCGICASDVHTITGRWGELMTPVIPGHEIIGKVITAGPQSVYKIYDLVGVGDVVDACEVCKNCKAGYDQHCKDVIYAYNALYPDGATAYVDYNHHIHVNGRYAYKITPISPPEKRGRQKSPRHELDILLLTSDNKNAEWGEPIEYLAANGTSVLLALPGLPTIDLPPFLFMQCQVTAAGPAIGRHEAIIEMLGFAAKTDVRPWIEGMSMSDAMLLSNTWVVMDTEAAVRYEK